MRYHNKMIWVPSKLHRPAPYAGTIENPDIKKLRDGTFEVEDGWRAISMQFINDNGVMLLLEKSIEEGYR